MSVKNVKILVAYHKPAPLLKSDVLVPIHLGRALGCDTSKDGSLSASDFQWMKDNMIGDDTGENISHLNRFFNEMTAIYWAWKNYDKLGNPDYIGLMHYRRVFYIKNKEFDIFVNNIVKSNIDLVCRFPSNMKDSGREYSSIEEYGKNKFQDLLTSLNYIKNLPEYCDFLPSFRQQNSSIFSNMFIMKKELFFHYCKFIFKNLFLSYENFGQTAQNKRTIGFISEYITSFYFNYLIQQKKISYLYNPILLLTDSFPSPINICFSCNNSYAPYLVVAINSLIKNTSLNRMYNIYILENEMSPTNKDYILNLQTDNVKIKFINLENILKQEKIRIEDLAINKYFSPETYFRFFIPTIFKDIQKILYLDCDIAVNSDIAELYDTDLNKNWFGVCRNVYSIYYLFNNKVTKDGIFLENYFRYVCGIKDPRENLFQAEVMLFNIEELRKTDFLHLCMNKLKEIGSPIFVDQDVLNAIAEYKVRFLPLDWNHVWYIQQPEIMKGKLPQNLYLEYTLARKSPKIIHYAGAIKPWADRDKILSEYFWNYIPQTVYERALSLIRTSKILKPFMQRKLQKNKFFILFCSKQEKKRFISNLLYFLTQANNDKNS
ncbi:MAG: DUF4422 domain-containing protein [Pseudomonadota bacterium]|nr:DUF4422 domain-containing protein [Pseudomonadota bacterium]